MDTISISNVKGEVFITGILESINGDLAVSTTKGLYIIDPGSDGTVSYEPVLEGCINVMIAQDKDHLWLGTNQGLLYYSYSNGLIKKLTSEDGLPSDVVHGLFAAADSTLWISTWHGMASLSADESFPVKIVHDKGRLLYGQMTEDTKGHIWAGGESELIILDDDQKLIRTIPSEINSKTLPPTFIPWQILLCDSRGSIWHAIPEKVSIYDPGPGIQRYCNLDFNFRIEQPTALFEDRDGSIWLATTLGNIYRYDLDLFSYQNLSLASIPFPTNSIVAVEPLYSDFLAVASNEGLYLTNKEFENARLILRDAVTAIDIDQENRIWVTSNDKLVGLEMDARSLEINEFLREKLPETDVSGLLTDGSYCWISTFDKGVLKLNLTGRELSSFLYHPGDQFSLSSNHITSMVLYGKKLWLGTVEGEINIIHPLTNEIEKYNVGPETNPSVKGMINHMVQLDDELWIAANAGISRIKDKKIRSLDHFTGKEVKQILADTSRFLWISHVNGIDVYDMENDRLYNVVGQSDTKAFSYLFRGSDQNNYLIIDREIRRYSHLLPELNESSTIISESKINSKSYPLNSGSKLAHDENDLEIVLSVLSYRNPEQNRYATYLEGKDTGWQESNSPLFTYQNLKPGKYIFHYRGANFTGKWGPEREIAFTIHTSAWFTKWAIAGYCLVGVLIFVIFIILRRRNLNLARDLQEKTFELEQLKKQFQGDLLNSLTTGKIEGRSLQSEDIQLLEKVIDFIDIHLSDDSFSVEDIAQGLSMSRTKLFRQMKLVAGVSPTEFIINYRLKLAAEMLKRRTGNISEIAFSVGYKNPAHFSDSFRKFYGCSPSEFANSPECNEKKSI